jgi:hypothetical protein
LRNSRKVCQLSRAAKPGESGISAVDINSTVNKIWTKDRLHRFAVARRRHFAIIELSAMQRHAGAIGTLNIIRIYNPLVQK